MSMGLNPYESESDVEARAFAERLAEEITRYWHARGYAIRVRVTAQGLFSSNTLNGYPIKRVH